jgi:hypothetical protein
MNLEDKKVDLDLNDENINKVFLVLSNMKDLIKKLKIINTFFETNHDKDIAYEFVKQVLGEPVSFYNDGCITHGNNILPNLTCEEIEFINDIHNNKKSGIHMINSIIVKYFGSTLIKNLNSKN